MKIQLLGLSVLITMLTACSSHQYQMGQYVNQLTAEQIYNPGAVLENAGYVPDGQGERMEKPYKVYTGKSDSSLSGTSSRVLNSK